MQMQICIVIGFIIGVAVGALYVYGYRCDEIDKIQILLNAVMDQYEKEKGCDYNDIL